MTTNTNDTPTPTPTTPQLPANFAPVKREDFLPLLDRPLFRHGAILTFIRTETYDTQYGRRKSHIFALGAVSGPRFKLRGTAAIDQMLRQARENATVFLRYGGQVPRKQNPEQSEHAWQLRIARGLAPDALKKVLLDYAANHAPIAAAYEQAVRQEQERRAQVAVQAGDEGWTDSMASEHDTDVPF